MVGCHINSIVGNPYIAARFGYENNVDERFFLNMKIDAVENTKSINTNTRFLSAAGAAGRVIATA